MKNVICIVNTHYQLIMALQIKRTIGTEWHVDLCVSDQSNEARTVADNLRQLSVFDNVYYVETKEFCKKNSSRKKVIKDISAAITGKLGILAFMDSNITYNELIFYNPDIFMHILYAHLAKKNRTIKVSRFEEGILSYDNKFEIYKKLQIIYGIRRMLGRKNLQMEVSRFYCFRPKMYRGGIKVESVPDIGATDKDFFRIVSKTFGVDVKTLFYPQKYIYFSSVYDFEGEEPAGELQLIKEITKIVGNENLIVKIHPRDDRQRFINAGIRIDGKSSLPWEAIQLNYDFSNHIFLTMASGSVLTVNGIIEKSPRTYVMYPLFRDKHNSILKTAARNFDRIYPQLSDYGLGNVRKIEIKEDLVRSLK